MGSGNWLSWLVLAGSCISEEAMWHKTIKLTGEAVSASHRLQQKLFKNVYKCCTGKGLCKRVSFPCFGTGLLLRSLANGPIIV